jgi:predicted metalloendopeptidase
VKTNEFYLQGYQKWKQANSNVDQKLPGLDNYTAEQLFFISYGHGWCSKMSDQYALNYILTDEHAPSEFR